MNLVKSVSPVSKSYTPKVMPWMRKNAKNILLPTVVVGGMMCVASLFKTPGKTLNQHKDRENYFDGFGLGTNDKYPASGGSYEYEHDMTYQYDSEESIASNIANAINVARNKFFANVVDPVAEHPVVPFAATALASLGLYCVNNKNPQAQSEQTSAQTESV